MEPDHREVVEQVVDEVQVGGEEVVEGWGATGLELAPVVNAFARDVEPKRHIR